MLVYPITDWQLVTMDTLTATYAIEMSLTSPDEGSLAVYKIGADGGADLQGEDSFYIDRGPNLIPSAAEDDQGLWIYEGASSTELFGIWYVGTDVPDHESVARLSYQDASEGTETAINAPIWSYDNGEDTPNMTVFHSVY